MNIYDWVIDFLGIDPLIASQYDYLIFAVSGAILIIIFSAIWTLLLSLGGLVSPRRQ